MAKRIQFQTYWKSKSYSRIHIFEFKYVLLCNLDSSQIFRISEFDWLIGVVIWVAHEPQRHPNTSANIAGIAWLSIGDVKSRTHFISQWRTEIIDDRLFVMIGITMCGGSKRACKSSTRCLRKWHYWFDNRQNFNTWTQCVGIYFIIGRARVKFKWDQRRLIHVWHR